MVSRSAELQMTAADYKAALAYQPAELLKVSAEADGRLREMVLDIHSDAALARKAEAEGLDSDPAIAARLAEARRKILSAALLYKTRDAVQIPADLETLAQERYAREKSKLMTLEGRKVAHILLTALKGCPCEVKPLGKRVTDLQKSLRDGADFAEAARKWSVDGTAGNGGVLPDPIRRDSKTVLAFQDAVFALEKAGDLSEPIQTEYGVHFIKLLEIEPGRQLSYDEVKDKLQAQITQEMRFSAMETLRGDAYPDPTQINYAALRNAVNELLPPPKAPMDVQPAAAPAAVPQAEAGAVPPKVDSKQ
ncbi:MAG: peptidylprolyl isomerase [Pseudomonadota bacterium]|nr:peptidylprolyl isomerase [Pseudomonadota bacterium]